MSSSAEADQVCLKLLFFAIRTSLHVLTLHLQAVELSQETLQHLGLSHRVPKSNKERAREHRSRKKAYYQQLEDKIFKLEEQVKALTEQNNELRDKLDKSSECKETAPSKTDSCLKLIKDEEVKPLQVPKILKSCPSQLRFTMVDQCKTLVSNYAADRIRLLKNPFRTIIENVIPLETKVLIACIDSLSVQKFVAIFKDKKRVRKQKYKLEDSELKSDLEEALAKCEFSDSLVDKWRTLGKDCKVVHLKLRTLMQKLVKVRNQIFTSLSSLNKLFAESGICEAYQSQDVESMFEMCKIVKEFGLIDSHNLWGIPLRALNSETYNESELSS